MYLVQVVGNDGPNDGKTNHLKSEAHGSGATQSDGGGTKSSTSLLLAGVGVAVAFGVLAAGFFARKSLGRKQVIRPLFHPSILLQGSIF